MTSDDNGEIGGHEDEALDEALRRSGQELRGSASHVDGRDVISRSLRRRMDRARRANIVLAAVSALLVVALAGALAMDRRGNGSGSESVNGANSKVPGTAADAATKLVASLPAEPVDPHKVQLVASVSRYDTCDALAGELRKVGAAHVGSNGFGGSTMMPLSRLVTREASASMAPDGSDKGDQAFAGQSSQGETLGTNVIVAGVDEPDSIKATGSLVVDITGNELRVTDTRVPAVVGTLNLGVNDQEASRFAYPNSLLVEGNRAVVFGSESVSAPPLPGDPSASRPSYEYLTVTFVDLSDPTKPSEVDRVRIEGSLVAARRVGNDVRIVTNSSLADLPMVMPTTPNSVAAALGQNRLAVAESSVDDWIPNWDRGESTPSEGLMGCGDVIVPDTFAGVQMTSLVQFPLDQKFEPSALGVLAPSEGLTASATDVVVASHVWVDPSEQTDDFTDWSTALHRFVFTDDGPKYVASGAVDGSVRDEFSLSALGDGTVGVVTVDVVPWQSHDEATVTVRLLGSHDGGTKLEQIGSFVPPDSGGGVAGVRFMGDRLLVTSGAFGTVVSAVDLTDRAAPRDLGSVPLDGTGEYIHPIGDNRVLVLGSTFKTVGENMHQGLHASLMDLNGAPTIVGRWALDDSSSQVNYDHHAFTWWAKRSIAAFGLTQSVPYSMAQPPSDAAFLTIAGDSITPLLVRPTEADLGPKCAPDQIDRSTCDDTGLAEVSRVLVVDGAPWLFTSESLEHLDPQSFASVAMVPLRNNWMFAR